MIVDRDALADKLGFTRNDIDMLIAMFHTNAHSSLEEMQKSIEVKDMQGIIDTAHAISGGAGTLGLDDIYKISKELEIAAKREERLDYPAYYKRLKILLDTL